MRAGSPLASLKLATAVACVLPAHAFAEDALTLPRAIQLAVERNERAGIAALQVEAADARLFKAKTFFFPDLTATGTAGLRPHTFQSRHPLNALVSLQMTVFDARLFPLYRAAVRDQEATSFNSKNQVRLLAFEAADAYLQTLGLQQVRDAARQRLELARRSLQESELRFKAGLVSSQDVTRVRLETVNAEQAHTRAEGDVQNARLNLGFILATDVTGPLASVEGVLPDEPAVPDTAGLVAQAEEDRPDLAAQIKRAEAAEALALEPLYRWFPFVTLGGQFRVFNEVGTNGRSTDALANLSLTWDLIDGGERIADRRERVAQARIAELNAHTTGRQVALDVRSAQVDLEVAKAAVKQAQVASEVARQNAKEVGSLYAQGLSSALDLADANQRLFEADVSLAREQYARSIAWLDLRAALGQGPLGEETKE